MAEVVFSQAFVQGVFCFFLKGKVQRGEHPQALFIQFTAFELVVYFSADVFPKPSSRLRQHQLGRGNGEGLDSAEATARTECSDGALRTRPTRLPLVNWV